MRGNGSTVRWRRYQERQQHDGDSASESGNSVSAAGMLLLPASEQVILSGLGRARKAGLMTTGTRLKITRSTIALDASTGKRTIVMVPLETILTVLPGFAHGD